MKKIICLMVAATLFMISLTGCGWNKRIIDTEYRFNYAYINVCGSWEKVEVDRWSEDATTFTIEAKNGKVYCSNQMNIMLVKE